MVKRRIKWIVGQIMKIGSIVIGLYLIMITFGYEPLKAIKEISNLKQGWSALGSILLQLLKLLFGIAYTFIGMAVLYRFGTHLTTKNQKN